MFFSDGLESIFSVDLILRRTVHIGAFGHKRNDSTSIIQFAFQVKFAGGIQRPAFSYGHPQIAALHGRELRTIHDIRLGLEPFGTHK